MRVIFTALASYGHLYPLIPLAVAARDAGHHVVFATSEEHLPTLRTAGLAHAPVGLSVRQGFAAAMAGESRHRGEISQAELLPVIAEVFGDVMPRAFAADLTRLFERERPELVVYEAGNQGGGLAAKLAGIAAVAHGFGRFSRSELGDAIRHRMLECAADLGVEVGDRPFFGDPFIDICPESVQSPEFLAGLDDRRIPLRPVGWNEPVPLPPGVADRDRARPLVYLTLGTAMGSVPVLRAAIDGLAVLDVDVLVAAGPTVQPVALGEVPANVRLESWVPQADLLAHVDLVVHHGGSGTLLGAFAAGLPQLLLPQGADQFTNADAVLEHGVGDRLVGAEVTAAAVSDRVRRLLVDPEVRAAAHRLADEVAAMPPPDSVAARLSTCR